jgi:hypothetical protein
LKRFYKSNASLKSVTKYAKTPKVVKEKIGLFNPKTGKNKPIFYIGNTILLLKNKMSPNPA